MGNEGELDKYINDLGGIEEENNDADTGVVDDGNGTGTADDASTGNDTQDQAVRRDEQVGAEQQTKKQVQPKGQQSQQSDQAATGKQPRPLGDGTFMDANGNITDQAGKVIAEKGFAARMYQTNQRLKERVQQAEGHLDNLLPRIKELEGIDNSIRSQNLDTQEVSQALELAGRMKRGDYLGVAKEVLALVMAQGYNVTDLLGGDVGDTIEMKSIQRMIDDRLAPLTREEQRRQQQEQATQNATKAYREFVRQNDYAEVHANDIAAVVQQKGVTPQQAYNAVRAFAYENGLDFSQPLKPQIEAIIAEQNKQPATQQRQNPTRPMPSGVNTRLNGAPQNLAPASADDDWGSIIRSVQETM